MDDDQSVTFDVLVQGKQETFWEMIKSKLQQGYNIRVSFNKPESGANLQTPQKTVPSKQTTKQASTAQHSSKSSRAVTQGQKEQPIWSQIKIDESALDVQSESLSRYHAMMGPQIYLSQKRPQDLQQSIDSVDFRGSTPDLCSPMSINERLPVNQEQQPTPITFQDYLAQSPLYQQLGTAKNDLRQQKWQEAMKQFIEIHASVKSTLNSTKYIEKKVLVLVGIKSLIYMAECQKYLGLSSNAIQSLEQCLKLYQVNDPEILCIIYEELAHLRLLSMQFTRALRTYRTLLGVYEKLNWKLQRAFSLAQIGHIYALFDYPEEAKRISYAAYDDLKQLIGLHDVRLAYMLDILGQICLLHKDWEFASTHLEQSLAIKHEDQKHPQESTVVTMQLLGIAYQHLGKFSRSFDIYSQALTLMRPEPSIQQAQIYNNMGLAALQDGQLVDARVAFGYSRQNYSQFFEPQSAYIKRLDRNKILLSLAEQQGHHHH